jgi:exodeoxyribonuclease V alpha subunit
LERDVVGFLRGQVERVLHTSGTFNILSFKIEEQSYFSAPRDTKATGHFFGLNYLPYGATLEIEGEWINHAKYGRQFKVTGWKPWAKGTREIQQFLESCVDVFSERSLVKKVVDRFGLDTYEVLRGHQILDVADNDAERDILLDAVLKWNQVLGLAALSDFLQEYNLGASLIAAVFNRFGFEAVEILANNPYRLVEIDGVSFERADSIAMLRGIGAGDPRRIAAGVISVIRDQIRQQGHLFVRRGDLPFLLEEMTKRATVAPFDVPDLSASVEEALTELERTESVRIDPGIGVYVPDMYQYERSGAAMLSRFLTPSELIIDLDLFLSDYEKTQSITLSDLQREAVCKLIANRVLVVTGAPGTGKTTLIRTFVHLFRTLGLSHMLMAPTGIAAKRLSHVTETHAQTIHRALKYDGFQWGFDHADQLDTQAVIVDEISMVDQELLYRLLDALDPKTMLVLVGDDAQLPSVGPGNVLRELIGCDSVPTIRLEHVFRQAETSDIVLAAHRIRRGATPLGLPKKPEDTEFKFVEIKNEAVIADLIVKIAIKLKARDANFQVLSPKYEGIVGVDNLNTLLRDALNPDVGQPSCDMLSLHARVGDRLMVIKNNYRLNVYNGDVGKLQAITREGLQVRIHGIGSSPDTEVMIPRDQAPHMLKLAYAVTVHRCQGEEFETVILPLVRAQGRMLQRNLFYTAVTRARKKVWLLGEVDAVLKAVANDKVIQRNTVFRSLVSPHVGEVDSQVV